MKRYLFIILIIFINVRLLYAQENISPLYVNPLLKHNVGAFSDNLKSTGLRSLPIMDDFSGGDIYPSPVLWADNYVFIDHYYYYYNPTIGVATLDAINNKGELYPTSSSFAFSADTLTTHSIRLDSVFYPIPRKISPADSVYLSFWYQPGGGKGYPWEHFGDVPEKGDSLMLELYRGMDTLHLSEDSTIIYEVWDKVWSVPGMPLDTFYNYYGTNFKQVLIPITDNAYFNDAFRFRFRNYASLANNMIPSWAGNVDMWHLDYVYMNVSRNRYDTAFNDLAFKSPAASLLKNYVAMPWKQFLVNPSAEMAVNPQSLYTNLSDETRQTNRNFRITDLTDRSQVYTSTGGNCNVEQFSDSTFTPPFTYTYHTSAIKYADFEVMYAVNTTPDINRDNDTIRFIQRFYNYYAYDDGSPENGYGLSPAGSMLAVAFQLNETDTLRAVDMFFNQTWEGASQQYFWLTIWDNNDSIPGSIISQELYIKPEFEDELNRFHTYILPEPLLLSGKFYIGWEQTTPDNLNLGFDRNTNSQDKIFYNTDGTWYNSMYKGSLMIRPILGSEDHPWQGIHDQGNTTFHVRLFPNPACDVLNIRMNYSPYEIMGSATLQIFDLSGRLLYQDAFSPEINVSRFQNGIYFIRIHGLAGQKAITAKFSIIR